MKQLDRLDKKILGYLYKNARLTNKELAGLVSIAPSTCLERVRRLQKDGIIKGAQVDIEHRAVGGNIQVMVSICLSNQSSDLFAQFRDEIIELPEILSIFHMSGQIDFMVHVSVKDTSHLRDFIFNTFTSRDEVAQVTTALIYEQIQSESLPAFD